MTLYRKMAKGAAWLVLVRLTDRSIGLISTLILARVLVPEDLPHHEQRVAGRHREGGEGMPEIMKSYPMQFRPLTDALPILLQAGIVAVGFPGR